MSKIDNVKIIQQGSGELYFGYLIKGEIKGIRKLTDKEYLELYSYFNYNLTVQEKIKKIHERTIANVNSND